MGSSSSRTKTLIGIIGAVLATVGVTIVVLDNGPDHPEGTPRGSVMIHIGGGPSGAPVTTITLDPKAQDVASQQAKDDEAGKHAASESDLHESVSPSPATLQKGNSTAPPGQPAIPEKIPFASQSTPGCVTRFVRNQSSRNGAKISLGVLHWTGSSNIANSDADILGNVHWFDTPAAQSSSNYITDDDGNCYYVVPEVAKAWTQANANPWSLSVEITNAGVQPLFVGSKGRSRVISLMRGWHSRWGIPYQHGAVNSSCVPTRPGFLAHRDLGICGGGHPDVGTFDVDGLIHQASIGSCSRRCRYVREHKDVHHRMSAEHCTTKPHPGPGCRRLIARNKAIHRTAKRRNWKLPL